MRADLNLVLTFSAAQVTGVITATYARHFVDTIDSSNWRQLGAIGNTPRPAINNGVIVALTDRASWTVTGTSYLTALSLDATSRVTAPGGGQVTMTVDGAPTAIAAGGSYSGAIVVAAA
jgi:hypothetical protein